MKTSEFKEIVTRENVLDSSSLLLLFNFLDAMEKWLPEKSFPEVLEEITDGVFSEEMKEKIRLGEVNEYSRNAPTQEQHTLIFGVNEIYERFFDNFLRKGRSLWSPDGKLHEAYAECASQDFWDNLNGLLEGEDLPPINVPLPPKERAVQFYEDSAFKEWYHICAVTMSDWLDKVTTLYCRFIVDASLQEG